MAIDYELFGTFQTAEMESAREIAGKFIPEINLPIEILEVTPLLESIHRS